MPNSLAYPDGSECTVSAMITWYVMIGAEANIFGEWEPKRKISSYNQSDHLLYICPPIYIASKRISGSNILNL